jgi:hypothetical protein
VPHRVPMDDELLVKVFVLVVLGGLVLAGAAHGRGAAGVDPSHTASAHIIGDVNGATAHWQSMPGRYGLTMVDGHAVPLATTYSDPVRGSVDVVYDGGMIVFDTLGNYGLALTTHRATGLGAARIEEARVASRSRGRYTRKGDDILLFSGPVNAPMQVGRATVVEGGLLTTLLVGPETDRRPASFLFLMDGAHPYVLPPAPALRAP